MGVMIVGIYMREKKIMEKSTIYYGRKGSNE